MNLAPSVKRGITAANLPRVWFILGGMLGVASLQPASGATNVWSTTLDFTEFMGLPGGFEDDSGGRVELQNSTNPGPQSRSYDVLRAQGVDGATGRTIYGTGQDGIADVDAGEAGVRGALDGWRSRGERAEGVRTALRPDRARDPAGGARRSVAR